MSTIVSETPTTNIKTIAARQAAFSDSLCEPEYAAVRQLLGLRPDAYADDGIDRHPDRRPCPSWCWVGQSGGVYDHEVYAEHPMEAEHHHGPIPSVVASLYQGSIVRDGDVNYVQAATIEPHLEQVGQGAPVIRVSLRHWKGRESKYAEILRLSLTDAQELATALTYLVETAES